MPNKVKAKHHKAKEHQISFREEKEIVERILAAAEKEDLTPADFVRKVFRQGFRRYEVLGSLFALINEGNQALLDRQGEIAKDAAKVERKKAS
jgi:hypothetical protein